MEVVDLILVCFDPNAIPGSVWYTFFFLIQLVLSAMAIFSLALVFLQDTGNFPHVSYFYF